MKHSEYPWKAVHRSTSTSLIKDKTGVVVCFVKTAKTPRVHKERINNANLIAAAPDLFYCCKAALGAFENNNAIDWNMLKMAIDKAESYEKI